MERGFQSEPMSPEKEAKKAAFEEYRAEQAKAIEEERAKPPIPEVDFTELGPLTEPLPFSTNTESTGPELDEDIDFGELDIQDGPETDLQKSA